MGAEQGVRLAFVKKKFSIHGGAERYLQTVIQHLKKKDHEIHIFANQWQEEGGVVFHKVSIIPLGSFLSAVTFNTHVKKAIHKNSRLHCIISFERTTYQDIYRAGEGCHAEWLEIRSRIEPPHKRLSHALNPLHISLLYLERKLFFNTRLIVANSNMVKEQILKHYAIPEEKITIIYNGIDLMRFNPKNKDLWGRAVRKSCNISDDFKVVLFVGSGFERKGLKTLIDAIRIIKKEDVKAVVVGKGNANKYKTLAERYGIADKIVFLSPQKEIEKFYGAADLFVLPTLYDPFSNATLEAMASGLPVITTRNNGAAELIDNEKEGFVLDTTSDPEEVADKIMNSLKNLEDMGNMSRKKAEAFPIEHTIQEFEGIIEKVCFSSK
jgi:UDP-glucose:(heptosyl)LPS alpha-1,3-glucosyltransferase